MSSHMNRKYARNYRKRKSEESSRQKEAKKPKKSRAEQMRELRQRRKENEKTLVILSNICIICLKINKLYVTGTEDAVKLMKYVLPEITLEPEIPVHICSTCHTKLHSFCTFKKQCLENYFHFTKKLRQSSNAKNQSFNAFPIETMYIKEEKQVDDDLINEAPKELNNQINYITEKGTVKTVQDETISPGLNRNIKVSDMSDDIKSIKCEEQHDQRNTFIEDNINIKEDIIKFEDSEEPNLYQELLSDIKKENDIYKIESVDLNINNAERTVSNVIEDLNQKINESDNKEQLKSFSKIKDYQCSVCEKKFTQNSHVKQHIKTHTGVKDFQCSICDKKFTQNSQLTLHMKTHTGVKDFQCSICEKKFIKNSNLKRHTKTHTGIKDFQCSNCNKKFTQNSHLKMHMKTHTGVKDFQCYICEKQFIRNSQLKLHMKSHTSV